jgi:hypothetical protein
MIAPMSTAQPTRIGIPLRPDRSALGREWRRGFVDDATSAVLARMRKTSAADVRREIRSAVQTTKVGAFPGDSIAQLMVLADDTAFAEILGLAFKVDMTGVASYNFLLPSNATHGVFIEEDRPIPPMQGVYSGMLIGTPKKLALITALSNELENYSAPVASVTISQLLRIAIGNGGCKVLLSADPETAAAPAGILNGIAPLAAGASASEDIKALLADISAAGISTTSVVLIVASDLFGALETMPWPLFKRRVIEANTLPPGTAIALAADGFIVAGEGTPVVDTSKSATLHMADPAGPISAAGSPDAVVSAPVVSMFQVDSFALRCVCRITWAVAPGSVAWIQNASW